MPSTEQTVSAEQSLLRAMEVFVRTLNETSRAVARQVECPRASLPIVRLLSRRGTAQVSDIAEAMHVDLSVASRQVSQLVADGYVERAVDEQDRRVRTLRLTGAGLGLAEQIDATMERFLHDELSGWSPDDLLRAAAVIERISAAIARPPGAPATAAAGAPPPAPVPVS